VSKAKLLAPVTAKRPSAISTCPITMVAVTPQRSAMRPAGKDISEGPM
jgi:hypothetical protein